MNKNGSLMNAFSFKTAVFILPLVILFTIPAAGQMLGGSDYDLPEGLRIYNQLEYSYDINKKREILEDWFNLDYSKGMFSAGIRFETFQPNDPNPAVSRSRKRFAEIDYKYFSFEIGDGYEGAEFTAGNYYELFGRGMLLKIYEDRNIRIDNNLLGAKLSAAYAGFKIKVMTGMPENGDGTRTDILHGIDLEYKPIRDLKIGGSYVSNRPELEGLATTELGSFRIQPSIWNFDAYAEYGIKKNHDILSSVFGDSEDFIGEAFYGNLSFYAGGLSLSGEYKHYDNFIFTSNDGTVIYNTPPALRKDYSYILLNRHPSPLDQSNEKGYFFEANYYFENGSALTAAYGKTETLPKSSYYQRVVGTNNPVQTQLEEVYTRAEHPFSDSFTGIAAFAYNQESAENTENVTGILEARYYFGDVNTLRFVIEHQQTDNRTTNEAYYSDVLAVEYMRSPKYSISLVTEMKTTEPEADNEIRRLYSFAQFTYKIGSHTDLSVLVGSREAGIICIGGVCRYEPKFEGVELQLLTRL